MNPLFTHDDEQAVRAWLVGVQALVPIAHGTVNRTLAVEAVNGRFVLRAYRHTARSPIEREHAVIEHAKQRGVPIVAPLPLAHGATIHEQTGRFYALFPFAPGVQVARSALGAEEAVAVGRCLARLHRALADFPHQHAVRRSFTVCNETTLQRITQIEQTIANLPYQGDENSTRWQD